MLQRVWHCVKDDKAAQFVVRDALVLPLVHYVTVCLTCRVNTRIDISLGQSSLEAESLYEVPP